jgi:HD domain
MDKVYLEIWKLAKPYYQLGRSYDIPHIEWMMKEADRIADSEGLNKKLLLPIVILHDVGYSSIKQNNPNIKDKVTKIIHMEEGAKIADRILADVDYDKELTEKIVYYISVHDNWLLGDDEPYKECREMAVFNDLDFLWATTSFNVFKGIADSMNKSPKEFYDFWLKDEKINRRPFCCDETREMWKKSIDEIGGII